MRKVGPKACNFLFSLTQKFEGSGLRIVSLILLFSSLLAIPTCDREPFLLVIGMRIGRCDRDKNR